MAEKRSSHPCESLTRIQSLDWEGDEFIYSFPEICSDLNLAFHVRGPHWLLQENYAQPAYARALAAITTQIARLGVKMRMTRQKNAFDEPVQPDNTNNKREILIQFHTHRMRDNVWHVKDSPWPYRFYFSRSGYSGWLTLSDAQRHFILEGPDCELEAKARLRAEAIRFCAGNFSMLPQQERKEIKPARPFVFFPLQMRHDTVAAHCRIEPLKAIEIAVAAAAETGRDLLIKRHPLCADPEYEAVLAAVARQPHVRLYQGSIHDALDGCERVLVANSSVGFAALMHFKPVVTFAASEYEICCQSTKDVDELAGVLREQSPAVDEERILRFLKVFLDELTFDPSDDQAVRRFLIEAVTSSISASQADG